MYVRTDSFFRHDQHVRVHEVSRHNHVPTVLFTEQCKPKTLPQTEGKKSPAYTAVAHRSVNPWSVTRYMHAAVLLAVPVTPVSSLGSSVPVYDMI